jgi:hypothetical protein
LCAGLGGNSRWLRRIPVFWHVPDLVEGLDGCDRFLWDWKITA